MDKDSSKVPELCTVRHGWSAIDVWKLNGPFTTYKEEYGGLWTIWTLKRRQTAYKGEYVGLGLYLKRSQTTNKWKFVEPDYVY